MLNEMNRTLLRLTNQARFIKMIVDKELIVSGRKRADIISELKRKNFDTFSKKDLAKDAGETEAAQEDEEDDDSSVGDGYNYLLGVRMNNSPWPVHSTNLLTLS
jgi:DNA topoisomerase-2